MSSLVLNSIPSPIPDHTPGAVLPTDQQIRVGHPATIGRDASLAADRNQWFLVAVLLSLVLAFVLYHYIELSQRADVHREVIWVKMYPNGTWDMEPHDNLQSTEYLQSTVNSLLKRWVATRFSRLPQTVVADYTQANYFLSPALTQEFVSEEGFSAATQAAEISACPDCQTLTYAVRTVDHYDQDTGTFANIEGTFYRTHLFATATTKLSDGRTDHEEPRIIRIQWRLMLPEEIHAIVNTQDGQRWLDHNPIGLEILAYSDIADPSHEEEG